MPRRKPTLRQLLEGYDLCCRVEGLSPRTTVWYQQKLRYFIDFIEGQGFPEIPSQLKADHIRAFILHLQGVKAWENNDHIPTQSRTLTPHTVRGYVVSIKAFCSWMVREGYLKESPMRHVRSPKLPLKVVPTFSLDQLKSIIKATGATRAPYRDKAIITLLLDTGMRVSELSGLAMHDIHLDEGWVKLLGKGNKERVVPIGSTVQKAIWNYTYRERPEPMPLVCTKLFRTITGRALSRNAIEQMVKDLGKSESIEGVRCSPHTFRHTFAITYLRNGGDVFSLQRILGHTSLAIVRMYVNMAESDVLAQHRKYSPADML